MAKMLIKDMFTIISARFKALSPKLNSYVYKSSQGYSHIKYENFLLSSKLTKAIDYIFRLYDKMIKRYYIPNRQGKYKCALKNILLQF